MLTRRHLLFLLPIPLALVLFALNRIGVVSGYLATPAGYAHLLQPHGIDNSIYLSWLRAGARELLHPDFQAPWLTDPAIFQPLLVVTARLSRLLGLSLDWGLALVHLSLYVVGAYALLIAIRRFIPDTKGRWASLGVMLLAVPIPSLLLVPSLVLPLDRLGLKPLPGLGFFVWLSSDGLLHGIAGSILVTWGTAATVAAFAFLAAYMQTERRGYLAAACAAVFLCGLVHPYEPFLIVSSGSLALLLWRGASWRRSVPAVVALGLSGSGIAPTALLALTTPWVHDAAGVSRWDPPNPAVLLIALGLPTVLACVLLVARRRMASPSDLLLQCWVGCALIGVYVPFIPWTQHFMDGFHYGVAMLVVRQLSQWPAVGVIWARHRRLVTSAVALLAVLAVGAPCAYYWQAWKDGRSPTPERLFSSVIPQSDLAMRDWLAEHASYDDLVLAPLSHATWFSSAPMHSFAAHVLFSITYPEQARLSNDFFAGRMGQAKEDEFLSAYGVRWVVIPTSRPTPPSLTRAVERARFGTWAVLEIAGNRMKPYPGLR